jgi:hypothetical protein
MAGRPPRGRSLLLALVSLYLAHCVGFIPAHLSPSQRSQPLLRSLRSVATFHVGLRVGGCLQPGASRGRGSVAPNGIRELSMVKKKKKKHTGPKKRADLLLIEQGLAANEKEALSLILGREVSIQPRCSSRKGCGFPRENTDV